MKRFIANGFLLAVSLALALALIEISVRLFVPMWYPRGAFVAGDETDYINAPGSSYVLETDEFSAQISHNELGFRDSPVPQEGAPVFALGDSFCWGFGVDYEKSYLTLLEASLGRKVAKGCVCGYGVRQELALFKKHAERINPDLVLLNFFIGNDLYESLSTRKLTVRDGYFYEIPPEDGSLTHKTITWVRNRFHAAEFVIERIKRSHALYGLAKRLGLTGGDVVDKLDLYTAKMSASEEEAWRVTKQYLAELNEAAAARGARLAVVLIPARSQVNPEPFIRDAAAAGIDAGSLDFERPNRLLSEYLAGLGVEVIDLLPHMRKWRMEHPETPLYFAVDPHWNERGHALAAEVVSSRLAKL